MTALTQRLETGREGQLGFDINQRLTPALCKAFIEHGYSFAIRYVRRASFHDFDLTFDEVTDILSSGLGLMIVQHVAPENWMPNKDLGMMQGTIAAREALALKVPAGTMVWLDLEGVAPEARALDIIEFCNTWYDQVKSKGFFPGLYVGFGAGLSGQALYRNLKFSRYWAAYNLNKDEMPLKRGVCMQQRVAKLADRIPGINQDGFDIDVIVPDLLGGLPEILFAGECQTR